VGVLLAALVGPYLIDWNSFRPNFERYASEILGQPVRIVGDAELRMLPAPTLTLESVEVGETEGRPMATVERFTMRVELLPLLAGQFRVTELTLDRPAVNVTVDDTGRLDWLIRQIGETGPDPDDVSFDEIRVNGGSLHFFDARNGSEFDFTAINTELFEGSSLAGPWRIRGSMICTGEFICETGVPTNFALATGRLAADGSLRVTADVSQFSESFAGTIRAEGTVRPEENALSYTGTFNVDRRTSPAAAAGDVAWSMSGGFRLDPEFLTLEDFSWQSGDGRLVFTGAGAIGIGDDASFEITAASRQIDLDQRLGAGGTVTAAAAGAEIWSPLAALAPPRIPGRISITVPSVIVSGSVLQELTLEAVSTADQWQVERFAIRLPGGTDLGFDGILTPGDAPGFSGNATLSVQQPSVLATWWYGRDMSDYMLPPVLLNAAVEIGEGAADLRDLTLTMDSSTLTGGIEWLAANEDRTLPQATVALATTSFDFDQLRSLAGLLLGPGFALSGSTTRYAVGFRADELRAGEIVIAGVETRFTAAPSGVTITDFVIGDLDGARITASGNIVDRPDDMPGGTLSVTIAAERLDGVAALAERLAPDAGLTAWFSARAPFLAPLDLRLDMDGPEASDLAYAFEIAGTAGDTNIRAEIGLQRGVADWAVGQADIVVELDAADGAELARQVGLFDPGDAAAGAATIDLTANGVPAGGLATQFQATLPGIVISSDGTLQADGINPAQFAGSVNINGNVAPLARLFGIALPGAGEEVPVVIDAGLTATGRTFAAEIESSSVAGRSVDGTLQLAEGPSGWGLTGALDIDEIGVGWLTAWPLGAPALPFAEGDAPWSPEPLAGPLLASPSIDLDLAVERLVVGEGLTLTGADLGFALGADRAHIQLHSASLAAGLVQSDIEIGFTDGQADLDGILTLIDVPLEPLVWQSGGEPVATGIVNLRADFSAFGRSMAGLIASLTGSGNINIEQGAFNHFGAGAFDQTVALVDEGEPLTGDILRDTFTGFLDAGTLEFGELAIAFQIVGGVVTPGQFSVEGGGLHAAGDGTIDLNLLTVDGTWNLTAAGGTDDGPQPQARVTFTGPLADAVRVVNVAPLASFLSVRQLREAERREAEQLELERFLRMIARIEADEAAAAEPAEPPPEPAPESPPAGEAAAAP